ncbi:MAG: hypothetical protein AAF937_02805 [Planctomycetota bacterium]
MNSRDHTQIESMLDALGEQTRAEPDAGFERRIEDAMREPSPAIRGRRRNRFAPAVLASLAAGIVAAFVIVLGTPTTSPTLSADAERDELAELSFALFDDVLGVDGSTALTADIDDLLHPTSLDEWITEGEPL